MRGSALSNSLVALRKCLANRQEDLDALLFSCAHHLIGPAAAQVFKQLGHRVPADIPQVEWPGGFDESILGYIYQLRQLSLRDALQSRVQQPNKQTSRQDLIAFTQLYTPDWVVKFLVERAVAGRAEATVLDPACGSGHFLLQAVDTIYDAWLSRGEKPEDAMEKAVQQVAGCDIDETGIFVAQLSLTTKAFRITNKIPVLNLRCINDDLGTLSPTALNEKFDAVVGNPPYIGRKLMDRTLKESLKKLYPNSHQDLCAAFLAKGLDLLKPGGKLAFITQSSLLFLPTYSELRKQILEQHQIECVVEAGTHVFPLVSGEKVNSVLVVLGNERRSAELSQYANISECADKEGALVETKFETVDQSLFQTTRAHAFSFECPPALHKLRNMIGTLSEKADIRQGLATTDNARFLRWWWEVPPEEIGKRWIPYAKGSGAERWYAPIDTVVDWQDNGAAIKARVAENYPYLRGKTEWVVKNEQYYFREGLTFSFVGSKSLSVRWLPPGCIFDVGGSALFSEEQDFLLAYLNSGLIATFARHLNPTINFQVGDLKELPYMAFSPESKSELAEHARKCIALKQEFHRLTRETSWREAPTELLEWSPQEIRAHLDLILAELAVVENKVDRIVDATARQYTDAIPHDERRPAQNPCSIDSQLAYLITSAHLLAHKELSGERADWVKLAVGFPMNQYIQGAFIEKHTRAHKGVVRLSL
jgi:tRNA1(Val) A37 N6-methylase TrmN6